MPQQPKQLTIQGIAGSPGITYGKIHLFTPREQQVPRYAITPEKVDREIQRFEQALTKTQQDITDLKKAVAEKLSEDEAHIFEAHRLILEDPVFKAQVLEELRDKRYNIEWSFHSVVQRSISTFKDMDNPIHAERSSDVEDVARRLLDNLVGNTESSLPQLDEPVILVTKDLSPSQTASLDLDRVLAVVTDMGGPTGHAAIMARAMGVPAVIGLHDITAKVQSGDTLLVNGYEGQITLHPDADKLTRCDDRRQRQERVEAIFATALPLLTETADGHPFGLKANIGGVQDAARAKALGADGVGLFRTEELCLSRNRFLSEDEQFAIYQKVVKEMESETVVFRTLDLGGDKMLGTQRGRSIGEDNPFMGCRSIRFCLEHKDVFKDQLSAILRVSALGPVKLMYPMISSVQEFIQAEALLEATKERLRQRGIAFDDNIETGAMIEIPGAAQIVDMLAEKCHFFSIGTNDLIQYLLAVDRNNDTVGHLYMPHHPSVLRTLKSIIKMAHKQSRPVTICGEMAGDPRFAPVLIGLGADALSVCASVLPEIKYLLRRVKLSEANKLAKSALAESDPAAILALLEAFYTEKMDDLQV